VQSWRAFSSSISGLSLAAALWAIGAPSFAHTDDRAEVVAVVQRITDAFNKGDITTLKSLCTDDLSVVDDMPPFAWSGPGAMDVWLGDVEKDAQLNKDTGAVTTLGSPSFVRVEGSRAYAVFPDQFSYVRDGRRTRELATLTVVLTKSNVGWRASSVAYAAGKH